MNLKHVSICILLIVISCSSKNTENKSKQDNKFEDFISGFTSLKFGLNIFEHDLIDYVDTIFDKNSDLIPNPKLRPINKSEYNFIKSKYVCDSTFHYCKISSTKINGNYLALIVQFNNNNTEFWINLNLFSSDGELLDTLTFAGQKEYDHNVYGQLHPDSSIETFAYYDIEIDSSNFSNYFATEVKKTYVISDDGHFNLMKSNQERACFTDVGIEKIVTRVNTKSSKNK
jgi:hypothetical protein